MSTVYERGIGFGTNCRMKYQLDRALSEKISIIKSVFDWQITPAYTICEYIDRDFNGMFDLQDLRLVGDDVENIRYKSIHPHEFPKDATQESVEAAYEQAKARHDHLCDKVRQALTDSAPLIIFMSVQLPADERAALENSIRNYNPSLVFSLIEAPDEGEPTNPEWPWQGDDLAWDRHFSSLAHLWGDEHRPEADHGRA